jgi:diguanylate cyclase (GGDEF)-like protein
MVEMSSDDADWQFMRAALRAMLDASDEGFIVFDGNGRCRMIARRAAEMFGVDATSHIDQPAAEVLEAFSRACDEPNAFLRATASSVGVAAAAAELEVRRPLARTVLCRSIAMPTGLADGESLGSARIIFVRDLTLERAAESSTRQLRARLRSLMPFDSLTGLLNQRRLYEELGREHSRSTRAWDSYALLRVDIDNLRVINDEFGTTSGDQVLEQVARRLETCVREYDVLARLDGDEFGVLLPGADQVAARAVGTRMARAVSSEAFPLAAAAGAASAAVAGDDEGPLRLAEPLLPPECHISVSVGGALWLPPSRQSAEAIYRRAGDALREARKQGGGQTYLIDA